MAQIYRYMIPINEPDGEDGSVTYDIVTLTSGRPAKRRKQMRNYMRKRFNINREQFKQVVDKLGFTDLH